VRLRLVGRSQMATNTSDYGSAAGSIRRTDPAPSYTMFQQFVAENRMTELLACAPYSRVNRRRRRPG
jgi:hypothetical protein